MNLEAQSKWNATAARYNLPAQPEWQQFLNHFDLSQSFALAVLLVTDADGADLCRVELEKQLQREGKTLVCLDIPGPDALRNLASELLTIKLPAHAGGLWIAGVVPDYANDFPAWQAAWQFALARLNPRRNEIRRQFNCSLIFVGAPWLQETMREIAPDLWSVRTLVAKIEPAVGAVPQITSSEKQSFDAAEIKVASDPLFAMQEAEKLRGKPDKELALARLLHHAGAGFAARNDWPAAEKAYTEALELKRKAGATAESQVDTLLNLAWACQILGQIYRSLEYAELALSNSRQTGNRNYEAAALSYLGLIHDDLGNTHKAIEFHERSLAIAKEMNDLRGESAALGNLGICYATLGDAHKAIQFHNRHLAIAREIGDRRGESSALGNLGNAYFALGDARKAIQFHNLQSAIAREIGDRRGEGTAIGNLGNAYLALGDSHKAIEFYEQHLEIARKIGDRRGEGNDLGNLGNAYFSLGDAKKAIDLYEQALAIDREIGDRRGESNDLSNLGTTYVALVDAHKANEFYEQALLIDREIGDRRGEAITLWNLALAFNKLDKRTEAITHAEAALKIFETIEYPETNQVRATLAAWRGQTPPA